MSSTLLNNPPAPEAKDVEAEFRRLADRWYREAGFLSNIDLACRHPAYRAIVELGPPVIPVLLRQLEERPGWWFDALEELTGANPVTAAEGGNLGRMAAVWVRWGREHGYLG